MEQHEIREAIAEALAACAERLPPLVEKCSAATLLFHTDRPGQALALVPDILDGLQWMLSVIGYVQQLGRGLALDPEALGPTLQELEDALQTKDLVLAADLFEYEIRPVLDRWLTQIERARA